MSPAASLQNAHSHQGQSDGQHHAPQRSCTRQGDSRSRGDGQGSLNETTATPLDHHTPYQERMDSRNSALNIAAMFYGAQSVNITGQPRFINVGNMGQLSDLRESRAFENLKPFVSFEALHDSSVQDFDRYVDQIIREKTLKQLQDWMDDPNATEQITWLRGPASIGKTAIALEIARQEQVVATFFFSKSDASRSDGNRLFTTLAWQLADSIPDIKCHINHFIDKHPDLPKKRIEDQFEYLVVQPFTAMENVTSTALPSGLVVIIDGVDECADIRLQRRFLQVIIKAILDRCVPLRFIISSTLYAHIQDIFDQFECPVLCIDLENFSSAEELKTREKDIKRREEELKDRVEEFEKKKEEIKRMEEEALRLREEILQKEDGTTKREAESWLRAKREEERQRELEMQRQNSHPPSPLLSFLLIILVLIAFLLLLLCLLELSLLLGMVILMPMARNRSRRTSRKKSLFKFKGRRG